MEKLNQNSYLGHMAIDIPIIMKKKTLRGEGDGLLAHVPESSWISCGNSGNFLKISGLVTSLDQKRFPPEATESNHMEPGKNVPVSTRG
jgi:hypothetical protein